jgi:CubicO group peptidase (beta-lactamase class C family)
MKSVWDTDQEKLTQTDATAYIRAALGPLRPAPKEGRNWMFAAGELAMTAHDLALWDESLIARSILKPESYKEMFTEVKLKDGKGTHYGLGVQVLQHDGKLELEHGGEVTGFVSDNVVLPDDGVAVAVLTNHMAGGAELIGSLVVDTVASTKRSAAEEQALAIYQGLQKGEIDRSLLAPNLNDYFDVQTVADFKDSLGPLGEPLTFRQGTENLRGGMTFRLFRIVYPTRTLLLTTYTYPDGKLEQFLVEPGN